MNMKKNYIVPKASVKSMYEADDLLQASAPNVTVDPTAPEVTEVDARGNSWTEYHSVWDE